ncbi:hypothetical protein I6M38_01830 [Shewanella algae]|uniref:hypothetical protein n=1 Tax=Shewanella algae TaxID=38313 RepID=UPI001AAD093A|nr:hypothetical protein [Shewanella algae]MBO2550716.1 hypothetical protein [Shewanella algae]
MNTFIETWWDIMEDKNLELCIKFCNSLTLRESKACVRLFRHNTFTESVSEARDYLKEILLKNVSIGSSTNNTKIDLPNTIRHLKEFIKTNILDDRDVYWIRDLDDEQLLFFYFVLRNYESPHHTIIKPIMTPFYNNGSSSLFHHSDENRVTIKNGTTLIE